MEFSPAACSESLLRCALKVKYEDDHRAQKGKVA
jgi:hypothetical protein